MSIENRNLKAGTKLVATYKKQEYSCTVKSTKDGLRFVLKDGREFKSPSSAGGAVMGGTACNGWKFWSIAEVASPKSKASKTRAKQAKPESPAAQKTEAAPEGEAEPE